MRILGVFAVASVMAASTADCTSHRVGRPPSKIEPAAGWTTMPFEAAPSVPAGLKDTPMITVSAMPELPILVDVPNTGLTGSVGEFPPSIVVRLMKPLDKLQIAIKASTLPTTEIRSYSLDGRKLGNDAEQFCTQGNQIVGSASAAGLYAVDVLTRDGAMKHGPFKLLIFGENRDIFRLPDAAPLDLPLAERGVIARFPLLLRTDLDDPLSRMFLFDRAPESLFAFVENTAGHSQLSRNEPVLLIDRVAFMTLDGYIINDSQQGFSPKPLAAVLTLPPHYRQTEMPPKLAEIACGNDPDCAAARNAVVGMQSDREAAYQTRRDRLLRRLAPRAGN